MLTLQIEKIICPRIKPQGLPIFRCGINEEEPTNYTKEVASEEGRGTIKNVSQSQVKKKKSKEGLFNYIKLYEKKKKQGKMRTKN